MLVIGIIIGISYSLGWRYYEFYRRSDIIYLPNGFLFLLLIITLGVGSLFLALGLERMNRIAIRTSIIMSPVLIIVFAGLTLDILHPDFIYLNWLTNPWVFVFASITIFFLISELNLLSIQKNLIPIPEGKNRSM